MFGSAGVVWKGRRKGKLGGSVLLQRRPEYLSPVWGSIGNVIGRPVRVAHGSALACSWRRGGRFVWAEAE